MSIHNEYDDELPQAMFLGKEGGMSTTIDPFSGGAFSDDEGGEQPETFERVKETLENGFELIKGDAVELSEKGIRVLARLKEDIEGQTGTSNVEQGRQLELFDDFEEITKTLASIAASVDGARRDAEKTLTMYESLGEIVSAEEMEERYRGIFASYGKSFIAYEELVSTLEGFEKKLSA